LSQQRRKQVSPYSCLDSFFPVGDPVKDMLTLKNTLQNAQIRETSASEGFIKTVTPPTGKLFTRKVMGNQREDDYKL
jgi:hypothetical protein